MGGIGPEACFGSVVSAVSKVANKAFLFLSLSPEMRAANRVRGEVEE